MKKISVIHSKCSACGMCVMGSDLLNELSDGKVEVILPGIIQDNMLEKMQSIVEMCPAQALAIEEVGQGKSRQQLLIELKSKMQAKLEMTLPSSDCYAFDKSAYSIPILNSPKEYQYKYNSDSQAEREGLSEFRDKIYLQKIPTIQQVVVSYKHDKLMKFLKYEECGGNYKYEMNKKLEKQLQAFVSEIELYHNKSLDLSDDFFYFQSRDSAILKDFILDGQIDQGWASRIAEELEPADWFDTWIDSDDTTICVQKKSWFSSDIEFEDKYMYCFKLSKAIQKLNDQILNECQNCIPELSRNVVKWEIEEYHKSLENEWNEKVKFLIGKL